MLVSRGLSAPGVAFAAVVSEGGEGAWALARPGKPPAEGRLFGLVDGEGSCDAASWAVAADHARLAARCSDHLPLVVDLALANAGAPPRRAVAPDPGPAGAADAAFAAMRVVGCSSLGKARRCCVSSVFNRDAAHVQPTWRVRLAPAT